MQLEALLSNADRLPSLPKVLQKLVAEFDQPDPDAQKIATLIGSDPVLAAKILKVANSAFFRRARSVGSLKEAVVFLGLHTVRMLVLGAGMAGAVRFIDRETRTQFWRYSLHTAVAARYVARLAKQDADTAFTAGLIHAIGEPLMREVFEEELRQIDEDAAFYDAERAGLERMALGYGYPDVGAALAEQWNFPQQVASAIRAAPDPFASGQFSALGACVHLGMQLAGSCERNEEPASAFSMLDTRLLETLKLDGTVVESMPHVTELTEGLQALVA